YQHLIRELPRRPQAREPLGSPVQLRTTCKKYKSASLGRMEQFEKFLEAVDPFVSLRLVGPGNVHQLLGRKRKRSLHPKFRGLGESDAVAGVTERAVRKIGQRGANENVRAHLRPDGGGAHRYVQRNQTQ